MEVTKQVKLGVLATVHTTFVAALSTAEMTKSAAALLVSISDTDPAAHVQFCEDSDDNWADCRLPIGNGEDARLEGLMPLRVFVESGADVPRPRLLVCVKWVCGERQPFWQRTRLTGNLVEGRKEAEYARSLARKYQSRLLTDSRPVQLQGGKTTEKRDIGVFDDTMEATLTLWGPMTASADPWDVSKTGKACQYP